MTGKERVRLLRAFASKAKECDRRGDTPCRTQAANDWRELATNAEERRAPRYIWWTGRRDP